MPSVNIPKHGKLIVEDQPAQTFPMGKVMSLPEGVRYLAGEDVMEISEATTPARRLYLGLQYAWCGYPVELGKERAIEFIGSPIPNTKKNRINVSSINAYLQEKKFWEALKVSELILQRDKDAARFIRNGAEMPDTVISIGQRQLMQLAL